MGDMTVQNGKLGVTIWASKTNQSGKGRSMVLATCADWELCPVIAVTEFLTLQGMGDSPLLYHCDGKPPPPPEQISVWGSYSQGFGSFEVKRC